jgi:LysM domain/Transglycosylase-like domain
MSGHRTTRSQPRHAAPQHSHPVITTAVGTVVVLGAGTAALAAPAPYTAPPMGDTLPATPAVQAAPQKPAVQAAGPAFYRIQEGDTLSSIAAAHGLGSNWEGLWAANRSGIDNPDLIQPGWVIKIETAPVTPALQLVIDRVLNPPAPKPVITVDAASSDASSQAPQAAAPSYSGTLSLSGMSGFEQCVISRESGGDPQIMNSTGHYGLFQFDYGTWVSGGGAPGDFGSASVAEQEQVFASVYAARGAEPWAPSDGC